MSSFCLVKQSMRSIVHTVQITFKGQTCDVLPNPTNGLVTITRLGSPGILPGSKAVYTCNGGYEINGNSIRDCQSDGTWSGSEPTCTPGKDHSL